MIMLGENRLLLYWTWMLNDLRKLQAGAKYENLSDDAPPL
jgi:hypothetical protein